MSDALPPSLLAVFPPDADALLAACCALVTDDKLVEISKADYGEDEDEHFRAIKKIHRSRRPLAEMGSMVPREVLSLVGWSVIRKSEWEHDKTEERGHVMRAFCCAAMLRAQAEPGNKYDTGGGLTALINLIDSAMFLQRGVPEAAARFLAWCVPIMHVGDDDRPLYAFGLVSLALLLRRDAFSETDMDTLVTFAESVDMAVRDPEGWYTPDELGGSPIDGVGPTRSKDAWRSLAARLHAHVPDSTRVTAMTKRFEPGAPKQRKKSRPPR